MIRLSLVLLFVSGLSVYALKDWYRSLCGLVLMMAVIEHPDMPRTMFGLQGLSPWNVLLFFVLVGWALQRPREARGFELPRGFALAFGIFLAVILLSFARLLLDRHAPGMPSVKTLMSDYLVNTLKWLVPAYLLFDGCRTRERFTLAIVCVMAVYLVLGIQVIKWMPLSAAASGAGLSRRSEILVRETGYHRSNLSMMLGGAAWAAFCVRGLTGRRLFALAGLFAWLLLGFAQALTGGRSGYLTWGAVGLVLCLLRWRRYLLLLPVLALGVVAVVPGVYQRMTEGFTAESRDQDRPDVQGAAPTGFDDEPDDYTITAGRSLIWPFVVEKIGESPLFGFGRQAMRRTGLASFLLEELHESFPHPHNAYLEISLDAGVVGLLAALFLFAWIVWRSLQLLRDARSPVFVAAGGAAASLTLAFLVSSVGNHTFYPREETVPMWCAIALMVRVWVERERVDAAQRLPPPRVRAVPASPPGPAPWIPPRRPASEPDATDRRLWASP